MDAVKWKVAQDESDFEPYLTNVPTAVIELFHRFIETARACGQVSFELQRGPVVLRGTRRIFASVVPTERGLSGHMNLTRRIDDRRIHQVEPLTKRLLFHRFMLTSMTDLDEAFGRWLFEARAIGDGARLSQRS